MADVVRDVIAPDFLLLCGCAQLLAVRQVNFLDKLPKSHAAVQRELPSVQPLPELNLQRHDVGFVKACYQQNLARIMARLRREYARIMARSMARLWRELTSMNFLIGQHLAGTQEL